MLLKLPLLLVGFLLEVSVDAYSSPLSRRRALETTSGAALASLFGPCPSFASTTTEPTITVPIHGTSYSVSIPRVGYSFYKTDAEQVPLCLQLALQAGITHLDVGSQYGTNAEVGKELKSYISKGLEGVPNQPNTKSERRQELFVSHKVSNEEQSEQTKAVKKVVKKQLKALGLDYLDLCSIHSPLTDAPRRLATYSALLELQNEGLVRAVGVCNYGVNPLQELLDADLSAPSVNQLVLSPFNQHKDAAEVCSKQGIVLACGAWSRLSSADGPQEGWAALADIGKSRGLTKAQVLVRWALQKGYLCVPRSGGKYKIERTAILENSYAGVKDTVLSEKEMATLDGLDEKLPAGRLGIVDGWTKADILSDTWDPTLAV